MFRPFLIWLSSGWIQLSEKLYNKKTIQYKYQCQFKERGTRFGLKKFFFGGGGHVYSW